MITSAESRLGEAKHQIEKYLGEADTALALTGSQRVISPIVAGVRARAGEFQQMNKAAQQQSTSEIKLQVVESQYDEFTINDAGEKIMPASMLTGLKARIEESFTAEVTRKDSNHGAGTIQFKLRDTDLNCFVIQNGNVTKLEETLIQFIAELNQNSPRKVSVLFSDKTNQLFTRGVSSNPQLPLELHRD